MKPGATALPVASMTVFAVSPRDADVDDAIAVDDDVADNPRYRNRRESCRRARGFMSGFDGRLLLRASGQQNQDQAGQSRHGRPLEASGVGAQYSAGALEAHVNKCSPKEKGARRRPSRSPGCIRLDPVDEDEQSQPDPVTEFQYQATASECNAVAV